MNGWEWLIVAVVGMVLVAIVAQLRRDHAETRLKLDREHEVTLARIEQEMFERSLSTQLTPFHSRPKVPDLLSRSLVQDAGARAVAAVERRNELRKDPRQATTVADPKDKPPPPPRPDAQNSARPPA